MYSCRYFILYEVSHEFVWLRFVIQRKMIFWHWFFSYLHLTLRRDSVVLCGKERETKMVFCLRGSCLSFCKGCLLSFAIWKMQGNLRGKNRSHFLIALINPVCSEGERTEETTRFTFLLPPSRSFSTVAFLFHYCLRFPTANPPSHWCSLSRCWYETLLVGFVWVLHSCLIIVSSCAFHGYWCECVVFFMLKNHILVCFLVIRLHLCLVVEVVYVHYLCLVEMHVCGKWFVAVFWFPCFHPLSTAIASL